MALRIIRNGFRELFHKFRPFRTRTDETHLTFQHIEQLRQFIDPCLPNKPPYAGYSVVILCRPTCSPILFGIDAHAPKLYHFEQPPVLAYTDLRIKNRRSPTALDHNRQCRQQHDRPTDGEQDETS